MIAVAPVANPLELTGAESIASKNTLTSCAPHWYISATSRLVDIAEAPLRELGAEAFALEAIGLRARAFATGPFSARGRREPETRNRH